MLTDWLILRRLAAELDPKLRGARIRAVGRLADGRLGLRLPAGVLALDAFGPTPIVALEGEAELERSAGWIRTLGDALEGLRIDRVRARRGDRLLGFECSSRSRFGVESGYRLVAELVPRFGNIVLLKDDTVVVAAKEFSGGGGAPRAAGARRTTRAGEPYEPPPLPAARALEGESGEAAAREALAAALGAVARADAVPEDDRAGRALRAAVPLLPVLIARSLLAECATVPGAAPDALARRCIARGSALVTSTEGEPSGLGDVYAYRDGGRLVQCHVLPLAQYAQLHVEREPSLLPLLAEAIGSATHDRASHAFAARRNAGRARLEKRLAILGTRREALERERDESETRDRLRVAGEMLYAHLADVPPGADSYVPPSDPSLTIALDPALDAKANAAAIFKRYRKAVGKLAHVAARLDEVDRDIRFASELAWELERAEPETLADVTESIERLERGKRASPAGGKAQQVKRRPLSVPVAADARIYVGRSPAGNADLTFRLARPDDLWFHARGTPGAHVVLHVDSAREATPDEVRLAASLAAYHSKARESDKVPVDYTERKHVRRQQNAPPGLVWYTGARTLLVAPRAAPGHLTSSGS